MGGLRKFMPITAGTFIVGWLAISGIIPFAGFWSKDEILAKAWFSHNYALWAIGAAAALMTAFYMTRQVWLVFYGPERCRDDAALRAGHAAPRTRATKCTTDTPAHEPHESPWTMYVPLVVLAVLVGRRRVHRPAVHQRQAQRARSLARPARGARTRRRSAPRSLLSTIALAIGVIGIVCGHLACTATGCAATAPTRPSNGSAVSRACSRTRGTSTSASPRLVSGPVTAFARFLSDDVDRPGIDGAVNGIATAARDGQRRAAPAADRPGAQLRARHRARHGAAPALRRDAGDVLMPPLLGDLTPVVSTSSKLGYPLLTFLVFLPALGALVTMLMPARRPELARVVGYVTSMATFGMAIFLLTQFDTSPLKSGYQLARGPLVDRSARRALDARRRRHQPVHGRAQRAAVPDRAPRVGQGRQAEAVHRLDAAARVGDDRRVPRARRDGVLHLLRVRARPDVLPHRGLGPRQPALRGDEVLPVHRGRLRVPVRGHRVGRVHAPARHARADVRRARRSPTGRPRTSTAAPPRCCSSRSRSGSRSRSRCSRSTRGCPTRTPTRRPRARSCWPA